MKNLDDYQEVAKEFFLENKFACLFDEPGVGKTGPAIMAAWEQMKGQVGYSTLITCPAYLIPNWEREIHDFVPGAVVVRADGAGIQERRKAFGAHADFVLTSYNNWSAKIGSDPTYRDLVDQEWAAYIFDEGHRLRGHNSAWTKHVFRVRHSRSANKDTPIWILTGTPFVRDGGDFFPYFHLYDKKQYGSYWRFVNERCVVVETPWSKNVGNISKGYAAQFREELSRFSLRRTTKDIPSLSQLEYRDTEYFVDLPKSVVAMIKKAKKEYVLDHPDLASPEFLTGSGALYVKQRQIATVPPTKQNPKLEWLKDFLTDKKGKVVVYVWFKDSARAICDSLGDRAVLITGDVPTTRRADVVDTWRSPSGPDVLVATISALKEGISLTESRDVVFLEHSELPADIEQCVKRLCRRGQNHLVRVHHVHANQSVDMVIRKSLDNRDIGIAEAMAKWIAEEEEDEWFT
jgi:SNF2 family DNA or RNA helicase